MPPCLGGEENGINLVAFDFAEMLNEMQPRLTASCRFDPYPNSNNGGYPVLGVRRDTTVKDIKPNAMKTIPAIIAFMLVYYALWMLSLPLTIMKRFMNAVAGEDE